MIRHYDKAVDEIAIIFFLIIKPLEYKAISLFDGKKFLPTKSAKGNKVNFIWDKIFLSYSHAIDCMAIVLLVQDFGGVPCRRLRRGRASEVVDSVDLLYITTSNS